MRFGIIGYMNNKLAIIITIIIIFQMLLTSPALAIDSGYARIVYNVRGLQDYDLHWNDRFPQGSVIKIYVEADGINHKREVAVDYVFVITDPNNIIVDTTTYSHRYHDYRENDFITYSKNVPSDWEDGVYSVDIHIFDLINDTAMINYYEDVLSSYINGSTKPSIPIIKRSDILNMSGSDEVKYHLSTIKTFYIDKYSGKYPMDRFRVENIMLDMKSVAPRTPVHISATVANTFYEPGSTSLSLLLDNKTIESKTVEIDGYGSSQIAFEVSSEIEGKHTVEIVPKGNNTIGLNLRSGFEVNVEKEIEIPTSFVYKDLVIDNMSFEPDDIVTISIMVKNAGKNGTKPVDLYLNDKLETTKDVTLNFSEIRNVEFKITKKEPGAYRVNIAKTNMSKIFFVESPIATPVEAPSEIPEKERKPEFNIVLGLSILVVIIYTLRLYLKRKMK